MAAAQLVGRPDFDGAQCYVEWTTEDQPEFSPERRVHFAAPADESDRIAARSADDDPGLSACRLDGHDHRAYASALTTRGPARVVVKSFHTACDTRHNVNNLNFIRGCHDYLLWTRDLAFLREQIGRIRTAMRFVEREFRTREKKCIYTTWPGHEGRSGVRWVDGKKQVVPGEGVGSNYWDLLPFGGEDALATVYYYDTLQDLAAMEEIVRDASGMESATSCRRV